MSKKDKGIRNIPVEYYEKSKITEENIGDFNREKMKKFAANVQLARAIPDIYDGFKPVARRVLYAIAIIAKAYKKNKKVLALRGDVIQIHPHGDSSVDDVITDLSKEWELTYPLIQIEGNNGNPSGDESAAARYLEGMITKYAYDCYFKEWSEDIVELSPSYNQDLMEPDYLISRFPDLLLRPTVGFAYGIATNIPSFNLQEAFNAVIELIKDKNYEPVLIPDMPCDCIILDEGKFPEICETGRGTFIMRADVTLNEEKNMITIDSIPYKVTLSNVIEKIVALQKSGELSALKDIFDASNKYTVRLQLTFVPGTDLNVVLAKLYKKTELQKTFPTLFTYVEQGGTAVYSLKEIMQTWIDNRRVIKRKYIIGKIVRGKELIHVLKALIAICKDEDKVEKIIKSIRNSEDDTLIEKLSKKYDITEGQAKWITNLALKRLSKTALKEYKKQYEDTIDEVEYNENLINHAKKIDKIIISELQEAIEKYNKPRRCRVVKYDKDEDSNLISNKEYTLVFTLNGLVKKLSEKAKELGSFNVGDNPVEIISINNRGSVIVFDSNGSVSAIKVADIDVMDKKNKGVNVTQFAHIKGKAISLFKQSDIKSNGEFLFITKKGIIKKSLVKQYSFKGTLNAIVLKDDDELVSVQYIEQNHDLLVYTKYGLGTRFNVEEVTNTNRMSTGVIGFDLFEGDEVIGVDTIGENDDRMLLITEKGYGKVCTLSSMPAKKRRGEIFKLIQLDKNDKLQYLAACNLNDIFLVVTKTGTVKLEVDEIVELTRNHAGKKIVPLPKGDLIIKCFKNK